MAFRFKKALELAKLESAHELADSGWRRGGGEDGDGPPEGPGLGAMAAGDGAARATGEGGKGERRGRRQGNRDWTRAATGRRGGARGKRGGGGVSTGDRAARAVMEQRGGAIGSGGSDWRRRRNE